VGGRFSCVSRHAYARAFKHLLLSAGNYVNYLFPLKPDTNHSSVLNF
jgi:hypothetical protein